MTLGLRRLKTDSKERKGTILLNPGASLSFTEIWTVTLTITRAGGPGVDGSTWSYAGLQGLATARLGPHYDIIGFSPRGTQNARFAQTRSIEPSEFLLNLHFIP